MRFYFSKYGSTAEKKITKKEAETLLSKRQIAEAVSALMEDPCESVEYMVSGGRVRIDI